MFYVGPKKKLEASNLILVLPQEKSSIISAIIKLGLLLYLPYRRSVLINYLDNLMGVMVRIVWRSLLGISVLLIFFGVIGLLYIESTLPSVDSLRDVRLKVPLRIFSQDGKLIAEFGEGRRNPVSLEQVPKDLINAVLATEDRRFYEHPGVDLRGLVRASVKLLVSSSIKEGGSTITMQVARNFFLTRKKTFTRKISEILLSFKIEKELSKDEILELYLNKIYFGKRAYGVAAAAEVYYGIPVEELSLDQIAMLAGLPQAPSTINPLHDPKAAFKRRKHVLDRMLSYHFITQEEYDAAVDTPLPTKYHGRQIEVDAPYVAEMVRQELFSRYGEEVYDLGFEVITTINSQHQTAANHALQKALLEYDQRHGYRKPTKKLSLSQHKTPEEELENWLRELKKEPSYGEILPGAVIHVEENQVSVLRQDGQYITIPWKGLSWAKLQLQNYRLGSAPQKPADVVSVGDVIYTQPFENQTWKMVQIPEASGAFVSLDADTGAYLALVGGFDYHLSSFNRVIQAERLPGSNFKPFLYAAALEEGYTLASVINDAPVVYTDPMTGVTWRPQNATKKFYGPTRLRISLSKSQNMVTIRLLRSIGVEKVIDFFVDRFGFNREKLPPYLSLALGTAEITPLEITVGYCVFANGGYRVTPHLIKKIVDYRGNIIDEPLPPKSVKTLDSKTAFLITSALQDAIQKGTGRRAKRIGRQDLAGKTGTTNEWLDAWYSGYNRDVVATAWMGFDEPRSLKEYGSMAALPMWMYYMESILKDKPEHTLKPPPGIISAKIDPTTGLLARDSQEDAIYEFFTEDTLPKQTPSGNQASTNAQTSSEEVEALF